MNVEHAKKVFPVFFPKNIVPKDAEYTEKEVYRVCRSGKIDHDAFLSTYEDVVIKKLYQINNIDFNDPGTYSTSTFENIKNARNILKCICKYSPPALLAFGTIKAEYGPCQLTKLREPKRKDSHVDWWIFDEVDPSSEFREVDYSD